MTSAHFVPSPQATGGSQMGNSYLSTWANCRRNWYNIYYRPEYGTDGALVGRGLQAKFGSVALDTGTIFHAGMAGWYISGVRDGVDTGERSLEHAIEMARASYRSIKHSFEREDEGLDAISKVETMLYAYADRYGPSSRVGSEWPDISVLCDEQGQPYVERDWAFQLKPGYTYTCRTDLLILHHGYLKTMEHKTTTAYGMKFIRDEIMMGSQFAGEYATLAHCVPDLTLSGVMLNIVLKDRSPNSKYAVAERETTTRTPGQVSRWKVSAIKLLQEIDDCVGEFEELLAAGWLPELAADVCFPDTGTRTQFCNKYNGCPFLPLCQNAGAESRAMATYSVRVPVQPQELLVGQ